MLKDLAQPQHETPLCVKSYSNMAGFTPELTEYFVFYSNERPHQSLGYQTLAVVCRTGQSGRASVLDYFEDRRGNFPVSQRPPGIHPKRTHDSAVLLQLKNWM